MSRQHSSLRLVLLWMAVIIAVAVAAWTATMLSVYLFPT